MTEEMENDKWMTDVDSKYRLVILAASRSKQLVSGARPRVQSNVRKATSLALEEIKQGLVRYTRSIPKSKVEEQEP